MKLIINESQLRLIVENEDQEIMFNKIKKLINSGRPSNIDLAITVMDAMDIPYSRFIDEYSGLFKGLEYKPNKRTMKGTTIKLFNKLKTIHQIKITDTESVPDFIFKLPDLKVIEFENIGNLDNLVAFNGYITINGIGVSSIPNLVKIDTLIINAHGSGGRNDNFESLPKLKEVNHLDLSFIQKFKDLSSLESANTCYIPGTGIDSIPNLTNVSYLNIKDTPLSENTTEEELRKQINVSYKILM